VLTVVLKAAPPRSVQEMVTLNFLVSGSFDPPVGTILSLAFLFTFSTVKLRVNKLSIVPGFEVPMLQDELEELKER